MVKSELSVDYLREILDYNPESGVFRWKVSNNNRVKVGDVAGTLKRDGYRRIMINGKAYLERRLAWFYVHGKWPKDMIDHINGIKDDNYIENLREATNAENQWNRTKRDNNTSGFKGVCWNKAAQKWQAQIRINNKVKYLGLFDSPEEAYAAYCKAAKELFGEFANYV